MSNATYEFEKGLGVRVCNYKILLFFLGISTSPILSYAPTNLNRPFDVLYKLNHVKKDNYACLGSNIEYGQTRDSRNPDSNKKKLLELYQDSQSSIAMLLGAREGSLIGELAQKVAPATDDGTRGRFKLEGEFEELDFTSYLQYLFSMQTIPGRFNVSLYFPFKEMRVSNTSWTDQTKDITFEDSLVKTNITNDIFTTVNTLGGLNLRDWRASGLGDVALLLGWSDEYVHKERNLEIVTLNFRGGFSFPTGIKRDEDKSFSLPIGNDGSFAFLISSGLDLLFKYRVKLGLDLEFLRVFDSTRFRRVKTDVNQTDFLLLNKGLMRKSYGGEWKFNLGLEGHHVIGGLSLLFAYQYIRHDEDKLHAKTNEFNDNIINSAQSLQDRTTHSLVFKLNYDLYKDSSEGGAKGSRRISPQLSAFYKVPVNGRRYINAATVGGQVGLNF